MVKAMIPVRKISGDPSGSIDSAVQKMLSLPNHRQVAVLTSLIDYLLQNGVYRGDLSHSVRKTGGHLLYMGVPIAYWPQGGGVLVDDPPQVLDVCQAIYRAHVDYSLVEKDTLNIKNPLLST